MQYTFLEGCYYGLGHVASKLFFVNILDVMCHIVHAATFQLGLCSVKMATQNKQNKTKQNNKNNKKLDLRSEEVGWVWLMGYLPTHGPDER
jgi:hypothetical protein